MNIGQDSNTFGPYLINISCGITIEKYQKIKRNIGKLAIFM